MFVKTGNYIRVRPRWEGGGIKNPKPVKASGGTRTHDLPISNRLLYPTELPQIGVINYLS